MPNKLIIYYFFPDPGERFLPSSLRVNLSHNFEGFSPLSTVGVYPPANPLPDSIEVSLSHGF